MSLRPRERLARSGIDALSSVDLLALILRVGDRNVPVEEAAFRVLPLISHRMPSHAELAEVGGVGQVRAASVLAALALGERLQRERYGQKLLTPDAVAAASADLCALPQEHCAVFYVSARHATLERTVSAIGTATAALIHPRDVFRPAILVNATAVALAHTHPSGDPEPSKADRITTRQLVQAGRQLGIELIDHVVCGHGGSFRSLRAVEPALFT